MFTIETRSLSGWEPLEGSYNLLSEALEELWEILIEDRLAFKDGYKPDYTTWEDYRIMQGDEPIISFDK